jgi:hypothetical protein
MPQMDDHDWRSEAAIKAHVQYWVDHEPKGSEFLNAATAFQDKFKTSTKPTTNQQVLKDLAEQSNKQRNKPSKMDQVQGSVEETRKEMKDMFQGLLTEFREMRMMYQANAEPKMTSQAGIEAQGTSVDGKASVIEVKRTLQKKLSKCQDEELKQLLRKLRVNLVHEDVRCSVLEEYMQWKTDGFDDMLSDELWRLLCDQSESIMKRHE